MKEWKWKINRKAAHVLIEVAKTGRFLWGMINQNVSCKSLETESIRLQYLGVAEAAQSQQSHNRPIRLCIPKNNGVYRNRNTERFAVSFT